MIRILPYYRRAFSIFWKEPAFRAVAVAALAVLLAGTVFYHFAEGWSWVDSLYFSTVTLASVGYGDFTPTTTATRLFTVFYILIGLSIVGAFLNLLLRAPMIMDGRDPSISRDAVMSANQETAARVAEVKRRRLRRLRRPRRWAARR